MKLTGFKTVAGRLLAAGGAAVVICTLVWQALAAGGNPDPARKGLSMAAMVLSAAVLVFREGLEAVLVLAAVTAGMARTSRRNFLRAVPVGAAAALVATVATWFIAIAIISAVNAPELAIQAATGLLAILVLLVVMNWFFHRIYWTGWIAHHGKRRKKLLDAPGTSEVRVFWGLALLGFTAVYREGFEVVLFLQNLRLQAGNALVLKGAGAGLALTLAVAVLTFAGHQRLPYKKMLVYTGILLGGVLLVMVGESVQEMQQAGWLISTPLHLHIPAWAGLWFSVFPNAESLAAQTAAALLVIGSYFSARRIRPRDRRDGEEERRAVNDQQTVHGSA